MTTLKKTVFLPQHPAGRPFVIGGAVVTLIGFLVWGFLGFMALLFTAFSVYFFRDPPRVTPQDDALVISPADGRVCQIEKDVPLPSDLVPEDDAQTLYTRISIFLSAIDVHVNRNPVSGKILKRAYRPGKFLNAALDAASTENERALALIESGHAKKYKIGLVQVAGFIARRIITDHQKDDMVVAGEKYGLIRFGSRMDIYIPATLEPLVCYDQRCIGGETVLAIMEGDQTSRTGKANA